MNLTENFYDGSSPGELYEWDYRVAHGTFSLGDLNMTVEGNVEAAYSLTPEEYGGTDNFRPAGLS